jgi:hypothetical protein
MDAGSEGMTVFKCQVTGNVSKPRQPQITLVLESREVHYTNFHPETEARIESRGFETVHEVKTFDPNWEEKRTPYVVPTIPGNSIGMHFTEAGYELIVNGGVVPTNLVKPYGCLGKRQLQRKFMAMNHFGKMVEMSTAYLKDEATKKATATA